ncbi:MAG: bifunctional phosphoribosylaminoimidazolecarboxamide formyltransferase/IMP cyclohydrolase, partial [bacterium]
MAVKRALISVYDKTNVTEFAAGLVKLNYEIISTGGTANALHTAGIPHKKVEEITQFPEIMDGRVKTLHPNVHGGILARRNVPADVQKLEELGIGMIDVVAVNLYPFVRTAANPNASLDDVIEMIDIGGPGMLRAAAKNYRWALPICRPADYARVLEALENGLDDETFRRGLAAEAFNHTAEYDRAVSSFLSGGDSSDFPEDLLLHFHRFQSLRYGENPHQKAAFYLPTRKSPGFEQLWGKELSFNNFLDLEAAAGLAADFAEPCVALIKHTVPCGVAIGNDPVVAYQKAFATDNMSPFGGIVGLNRPLPAALAEELSKVFYEVIVAPDYEPEALDILKKKKNLRLIRMPDMLQTSDDMRSSVGGLLVQQRDTVAPKSDNWRVVTKRVPS